MKIICWQALSHGLVVSSASFVECTDKSTITRLGTESKIDAIFTEMHNSWESSASKIFIFPLAPRTSKSFNLFKTDDSVSKNWYYLHYILVITAISFYEFDTLLNVL